MLSFDLTFAMAHYVHIRSDNPSNVDNNYTTLSSPHKKAIRKMIAARYGKKLLRMHPSRLWELVIEECVIFRKAFNLPLYCETVYSHGKQTCCRTALSDNDTAIKRLDFD